MKIFGAWNRLLFKFNFRNRAPGLASATFVLCRPVAADSAISIAPARHPVAVQAERPRSGFRFTQKTFRAFGTQTGSMEMRIRFGGLFWRTMGQAGIKTFGNWVNAVWRMGYLAATNIYNTMICFRSAGRIYFRW